MTHRCRMASGLVLLLVMLGLPVAPVVCELACPQAAGPVAVPEPRQVMASATAEAPCHEPDGADAGAPSDIDTSAAAFGLDAGASHGCDHPAVLSSPRAPEVLRVPEPSTIAWETSRHLSPLAASRAVVAAMAAARAPSRPPGASFSPVLRI